MTPIAALVCKDCGKDLAVEWENEPPPKTACKHQVLGQHVGDGPCPLCAASDAQVVTDLLERAPVCRDCKTREETRAKEREDREEAQRFMDHAGLPLPLRALKWEDLVQTGKRTVAIAAAHKWAEAPASEARGLYLWGAAGTGKTRLAATAAWARLEGRHPLRWVSVAVLLASLEASFSDRERQHALRLLTGDGPLVLDDIDKVNPSESKRAQLFAAIDRRVSAGVPLLVTGNLSPKDLESKLDAPIASRILGFSLGRTFEMDGPDRRMTLEE